MAQAKESTSSRSSGRLKSSKSPKRPKRRTADSIFYELTRSMCPICKKLIDAEIHLKDGQVIMRKRCSDHGRFEVLISPDADGYLDQLRYNKPGDIPLEFSTEIKDGCPYDCGLCPEHKQHACLVIIEVNTGCNMACPTCFMDAGTGYNLRTDEVETMLDTFVRTEGDPEVVQFSGGEPTLHPQLLEFIKMAQDKGIRHVMVNTNGRRLVEDPAWADEFCALNPMVYLQFDGFEEETYLKMRGESLLDEKMAALDVLEKHNINTILTATIERDVNEHEIPAIIKFGFKHPAVRGVMLQPVFHTGRHLEYLDPMNRVTIPELILRIDAGMDGQIVKSDFIPVPCCHPSCQSIAYAYIEGEVVTPLARIVDVDEYLDYITNRVWPDPEGEIREALAGMWSSSAAPGSDTMADDFVCATCNIDFRIPSNVAKHIFAITIKDFQDPYTFDIKKLMKCCVEIATPDGRLIPFCAYNTVGYREDVKKEIMMSRARERFERRTNGSAAKASAASPGDSD